MSYRPNSLLISDAVHGDMLFTPCEAEIIGTKEVQRLRRVRQLGFTHLVFPTALHTRFDHSLGACWVSKQICGFLTGADPRSPRRGNVSEAITEVERKLLLMFSKLQQDQQRARNAWTQMVAIAALLHDVTHIPYGHTLEDEFTDFPKHDDLGNHRLYNALFGETSDIAKVFEGSELIPGMPGDAVRDLVYLMLSFKETIAFGEQLEEPQGIESYESFDEWLSRPAAEKMSNAAIERLRYAYKTYGTDAKTRVFEPFMADIVGNTVCADLLDYLQRDSFFCGINNAFHERIFHLLDVGSEESLSKRPRLYLRLRDRRSAARNDRKQALLKLLHLRFELAASIYYHPVKAAASAMLGRALEIARKSDIQMIAPELGLRFDESYFFGDDVSDDVIVSDLRRFFKISQQKAVAATPLNKAYLEQGFQLSDDLWNRRLYKRFYSGTPAPIRDELAVSHAIARYRDDGIAPRKPSDERVAFEQKLLLELLAGFETPRRSEWINKVGFLLYCPGRKMQAKLARVRVSGLEGDRIAPLIAHSSLLLEELAVLQRRYFELWRVYAFAHPEISSADGAFDSSTLERTRVIAEKELGLRNEMIAPPIPGSEVFSQVDRPVADVHADFLRFVGQQGSRSGAWFAATAKVFANAGPDARGLFTLTSKQGRKAATRPMDAAKHLSLPARERFKAYERRIHEMQTETGPLFDLAESPADE